MLEKTITKNKQTILVISVACLLLCIFFAGKWGVAAISHDIAMNHLYSWQKLKKIADEEMWTEVEWALQLATSIDEANADYHNDLGRLYEYTASTNMFTDRKNSELRHRALYSFRKSLELRPDWPVAWANLALIKYSLQNIDDEFEKALTTAVQQGVALSDVQKIVTEAGIANWQVLSKHTRQSVLLAIHGGLTNKNKHFVISTMEHYNMKPYFCIVLSDEDKDKVCR